MDLDDAQPVEQILAERALRDHLREVAVARRDDPRLERVRARVADALERALLQHAQQLRLQLDRNLADLVEEQRALARELEPAGAIADRAGERALDVTEQLALEHAGCERGAAHGDERPLLGVRRVVDRARDELLAGARLAADQHRRARRRDRADLLPDVADRRALAEDLAGVRTTCGELDQLRARLAARERGLHDRAQPIDVDRLDQVLVGAELDRLDGRLHVVARGHDDDRRLGRALRERGEHVEAGAAGQAEIEQHQVGAVGAQRSRPARLARS